MADKMHKPVRTLVRVLGLLPILVGLLSACASTGGRSAPPSEEEAAAGNACASPRPMVCTMEYRPVCATLADGATATYSSGCNACADVAVQSWVEEACEGSRQ